MVEVLRRLRVRNEMAVSRRLVVGTWVLAFQADVARKVRGLRRHRCPSVVRLAGCDRPAVQCTQIVNALLFRKPRTCTCPSES